MRANFLDFRADVLITTCLITEQRDAEALNPWLTSGGRRGESRLHLIPLGTFRVMPHFKKIKILKSCVRSEPCFHEYIFHTQSIARLYTHSHTQQSHFWKCKASDLMFSLGIPLLSVWWSSGGGGGGGGSGWSQTATWQQPLQHRVLSDGSRVNCSTLDQTYWFPSTGTAILWAGSVLPWQNDYFFIISLIFHHYCTSTSSRPLPTALPRGNYATDVFRFPLRRRPTCQGSSALRRTSIHTIWS